jgi:hypothetical protein
MLTRELKSQFAAALQRLLRPVVRQMIAYGVTFPAFSEIARRLYVEVAEREFALPFKRQTDSRLALITGLSRKEIAQLTRRQRDRAGVAEIEDSVVTHVIGRWMAGPPYAAPDGVPRRLRYDPGVERTPSFARLVREVAADAPVRAVLDELLRLGSVALTPAGEVELRSEVHIPAAAEHGKLALLGSDPAELFATIAHNIEHPAEPWLHRKVAYDHIGADALAALQEEARRVGLDFVRRANALLASYDRDRHPDAPGGRRTRVVLGVYYFEEAVVPEPEDAAPPPTDVPGRIRRPR